MERRQDQAGVRAVHLAAFGDHGRTWPTRWTLSPLPRSVGLVTVAFGDGGGPMYGHSLADPDADGPVREVMQFAAASSG